MKKIKIIELISNHFIKNGYTIELRDKNQKLWNNVLDQSEYVPCNYLFYSFDYEYQYQKNIYEECLDVSFIIKKNNNLILIWPFLIVKEKINSYSIFSYDKTLYPPLTSKNISIKIKKEIINLCLNLIDKLSNQLNIKKITAIDSFKNKIDISLWHQLLIKKNIILKVKYDLLLNLQNDINIIKKNFRKSSKSLINKGNKIWNVKIMKNLDENTWNKFKDLHFKVSGKRTRPDTTWMLHKKQIQEKEAFLVYLEDTSKTIVGAGFFCFSKQECSYRAGVYKRELFDKPLGHTVQAKAIEEMKKMNLTWYNIGPNYYKFYDPEPNDKEISISYFKKGFASHIIPKYEFTINYNEN